MRARVAIVFLAAVGLTNGLTLGDTPDQDYL
jgi:hypothetical protein